MADRFERLYDLLNPFSHLIPINPGKVLDSVVRLALASPSNANQFWASNAEMMIHHLQLFNQTLLKVLGLEAGGRVLLRGLPPSLDSPGPEQLFPARGSLRHR